MVSCMTLMIVQDVEHVVSMVIGKNQIKPCIENTMKNYLLKYKRIKLKEFNELEFSYNKLHYRKVIKKRKL